MPLVVPSAENLFYCDEPIEDWIGDGIQVEWTKCATMGATKPKPDYTAGLLGKAFTEDENNKLWNYASPLRPFFFTPELSFPFLMCEAKSGEEGLNKAHRQNVHSASIAVRAIIELYREAFGASDPDRVSKLYGQILVFTISHNHDIAYIYGHYAVSADDVSGKLEFYRYNIALFSLSLNEGRDLLKTYNFVQNVYEKFAPEHRKRIKDAVARLKLPGERTGLSFSASSLALEESNSQADSQETRGEEDVFQVPSEPASASLKKQQKLMNVQMQQANKKVQEQLQENERLKGQIDMLLRQQQEQQKQYKEIIEMLKQQSPSNGSGK